MAITINKGKTTLKSTAVNYVDDKTAEVALELSLTAGEYTATATGVVADKTLTKAFTVDSDEYIKTIELVTKDAPMDGMTGNTSTTVAGGYKDNQIATVVYTMKNQYDEPVSKSVQTPTFTASTSVNPVKGDYKNGKGVVYILNSGTNAFIPGNEVYINAVLTVGTHVATMTDTVKIVMPANFDKAEIKGVYNKTLKKLDTLESAKFAAEKASDRYVYQLLFTAIDQYDVEMDAEKVVGKIVNGDNVLTAISTNPMFISIGTLATNVENVDLDGKTYIALTLDPGTTKALAAQGGTATIQLISSSTGTKTEYNITADAAGAIAKLTLGTPAEYCVDGEKVEIPFEAVDQYGNSVTKYDSFFDQNGPVVTLNASAGAKIDLEKQTDGTVKMILTMKNGTNLLGATKIQDVPVYITAVLKGNGYYSSTNVSVKEEAYPYSIGGLKASSKINTSLDVTSTADLKITYKDIDVLDQYGRVMKNDKVKDFLTASSGSKYTIYAVESNVPAQVVSIGSITGTTTTNYNNASGNIVGITDTVSLVVRPAHSNVDGTERITFGLKKIDAITSGAISGAAGYKNTVSEKNVTFSSAKQTEYASYEVEDLGTMYYNTSSSALSTTIDKYVKTVKVFGVKADGTKVQLPDTYYDITNDSKDKTLVTSGSAVAQTSSSISYDDESFKNATDKTYKDVTVNVTVNVKNSASGAYVTSIKKELKLSNKAPKIATAAFKSAVVDDGKATITSTSSITSGDLVSYFIDTDSLKDQYGVKNTSAALTKIIVSDPEDADEDETLQVTGNDTSSCALSGVEDGDRFKLTFVYDNASISVNVVVQAP